MRHSKESSKSLAPRLLSPISIKMLLFDIDGTLLLAGGAGIRSFERAFEEIFGIKDCWGDLHPDGRTDPAIFEEIFRRHLKRRFRPSEYKRLRKRYLHHFEREIKRGPRFRVLPGISKLLTTLSQRKDLHLGVATGNFKEAAWQKLKRGKLHGHFRFGGFGCDSIERHELVSKAIERGERILKRRLSPKNIFVIGDAPQDIMAGHRLGVNTIAVATGRTPAQKLRSLRPTYFLTDLSDTKKFLNLIES